MRNGLLKLHIATLIFRIWKPYLLTPFSKTGSIWGNRTKLCLSRNILLCQSDIKIFAKNGVFWRNFIWSSVDYFDFYEACTLNYSKLFSCIEIITPSRRIGFVNSAYNLPQAHPKFCYCFGCFLTFLHLWKQK